MCKKIKKSYKEYSKYMPLQIELAGIMKKVLTKWSKKDVNKKYRDEDFQLVSWVDKVVEVISSEFDNVIDVTVNRNII